MSNRSWSSGAWYRVAGFRPRLRAHASIYRHQFRGDIWFVLQDRSSGRFHRFTPEAHRLIAMMDGQRSLDDIWALACDQLEVDAVTQDELVSLIGRLHTADVLRGDVPPDIVEMSERGRKMKRQKMVRSVLNPLALRVPVFDPDDFLTATMPLVRPLISVFGALLWLLLIVYGGVLLALNWDPLTENVADRVLSTDNLPLLLVSYPLIKAFHELGHAYTIKRWGGGVHEIGVMFLVFMPVPYVDASDSIAFDNKWRRVLVGAAGILVELALAAIAMIVWANAEEGLVRAFAFNVMLVGGVSTLLFNGNPLLRFDGYYVLCDLIEVPNLGQRANKYLAYLVQRFGFGMTWAENPVTARGEARWFVFYSISAFIYRLFITFAIVTLVATKFFIIGIVLACWAVFLMLVLPVLKMGWYLFTSPQLRRKRGRALGVTFGSLGAIVAVLLFVPVPYHTMAEGVVAPPQQAYVNAASAGVVSEISVSSGETVTAGTPLAVISDPLIASQRAVLVARINELNQRLSVELSFDPVAARIMQQERDAAQAELELTDFRIDALTLRASMDGQVILSNKADLIGRYARPGQLFAVVADYDDPLIRVVVTEDKADLVRRRTESLSVRFAAAPEETYPAHIASDTPALSRDVPSLALTPEGGGLIVLDPAAPLSAPLALDGLYHLDLRLNASHSVSTYGDRVYVRFSHGSAPIAERLYRRASQIFLRYLAPLV
jgi:putative peptide zinc metalloprotease protein